MYSDTTITLTIQIVIKTRYSNLGIDPIILTLISTNSSVLHAGQCKWGCLIVEMIIWSIALGLERPNHAGLIRIFNSTRSEVEERW